ncbi:MAG TPA: hypothetical protein VK604_01955, partial [Bryobacteraceae bacterium]|nr:hypothetical protein [Bryobacteraceae bacterium]
VISRRKTSGGKGDAAAVHFRHVGKSKSKQALHIFKKDLSYLRFEIGMTLLTAAAFCFTGIRHGLTVAAAGANQDAAWTLLTLFCQ